MELRWAGVAFNRGVLARTKVGDVVLSKLAMNQLGSIVGVLVGGSYM